MTGVQNCVAWDFGKSLQTFDHLDTVGPGEVGSAAAVKEQRVTSDKLAVDEKTLAAGCVPRCVEQGDVDGTDAEDITGAVLDEVIRADVGGLSDPFGLIGLNVNGTVDLVEE